MDKDTRDNYREIEELVRRLIECSLSREGIGISPGSGFRIIIAGGELPAEVMSRLHRGEDMTIEPSTEIHKIESEVLVLAEIPGVDEDHLHLQFLGSSLRISALGHECRYEKVVDLPQVDAGSMSHHLKNGVLEVRFRITKERTLSSGSSPPL